MRRCTTMRVRRSDLELGTLGVPGVCWVCWVGWAGWVQGPRRRAHRSAVRRSTLAMPQEGGYNRKEERVLTLMAAASCVLRRDALARTSSRYSQRRAHAARWAREAARSGDSKPREMWLRCTSSAGIRDETAILSAPFTVPSVDVPSRPTRPIYLDRNRDRREG